jgi:hypothetical protein
VQDDSKAGASSAHSKRFAQFGYGFTAPRPSRRSKARGGDGAGHGEDDLDAAENLLASPHDTKERARLEVLVARETYGLDTEDWQHLTGTFTYGSGDTKAELDEIIARSRELW